MLRKFVILAVAACVWLPAVAARAQFQQGDFDLKLTGAGFSDREFRNTAAGFDGSLGYLLTNNLEVYLNQGLGIGSTFGRASGTAADVDQITGLSGIGLDFDIPIGQFEPFIGANVMTTYGQYETEKWVAGPEAGFDFFLNASTYIYASAAWEISTHTINESGVFYQLGIGYKWH